MKYFRVPQTKAFLKMVKDTKEAFGENTDSKAIHILMRWGHKAIFDRKWPTSGS